MIYRVEKNEPVSDGVRRIAAEEIHAVMAELGSVPLDSENIHEARRHLKKLRALLRFAREPFSNALFRKENQTFRAMGKRLSPVRDAFIINQAFALVLKHSSGKTKTRFRFLSTAFQNDCERRTIGKAELARIMKSLRAALGRVELWPLGDFGLREVRAALERSFRRGKKTFRKSLNTETSEAFHEWRKRVKDLEFHLSLLELTWRKGMKRPWSKIQRLDNFLGEDHDLAVLSEKLHLFKFKGEELQNGYRKLVAVIGRRRAKFQHRAIRIGKDLFAKRPRSFVCQNVGLEFFT